MADARVTAIAEHWGPRLVANGVDPADLRAAVERIDAWDDWLDVWFGAAEQDAARAIDADAAGHARTAGEAWRRAALAYHVAKFNWPLTDERARTATRLAAEAHAAALAHLDPTAERVEAPLDGAHVFATLRLPRTPRPAPLVILIPGFDSAKEEFGAWEEVFLARGMATLSLDGPGQGETALALPLAADYERAVAAVLDALDGRDDVDTGRVALAGISLGGLYAIRAAATDARVAAVAAISAPHDLGGLWPQLRGLLKLTFTHRARAADDAEAGALAAELSAERFLARVDAPLLVVAGGRDRVIPVEETRRLADGARQPTWVLFEDGNHVCNNLAHRYRPLVADWLCDALA